MAKEQRDEALAEFIREQNKREKTLPPFSYLEVLKKERPFIEKFTSHTIRILQRMSGIFVKFDQYTEAKNPIKLPAFAAQVDHFDMQGERVIRYIMLLDDAIAKIMHEKVCKRNNVDTKDVSLNESLCELLNIICCTSCNSCQAYAKLDASVPQIIENRETYDFDNKETIILVSLVSPHGPIKCLLSFVWKD